MYKNCRHRQGKRRNCVLVMQKKEADRQKINETLHRKLFSCVSAQTYYVSLRTFFDEKSAEEMDKKSEKKEDQLR